MPMAVPDPGGRAGDCGTALKKTIFSRIIWYCEYIMVMHNCENTCDLDYLDDTITHNSVERKGGRGSTDRTVSVAWACKWYDFKYPVVWSWRINSFMPPPSPKQNSGNFGWAGGTYPQFQGCWAGVCDTLHHPSSILFFCFHCKSHVVKQSQSY